MIPRRLIRWKSFWFGILVLGFLGWSWVRSMDFEEGISWVVPPHRLALAHEAGSAFLVLRQTPSAASFYMGGQPIDPDEQVTWFPAPFRFELENDVQRVIGFAHWFLILLFLVPWSAFLAWRWQRQRKLTTNPCAFS